jgi:hypothetical protein
MKKISAEELDRIFDEGEEDILPYLDLNHIRRPGKESKRVNVDFPAWMVAALDKEARRFGVTRQSLIKLWLADRLSGAARHNPLPPSNR